MSITHIHTPIFFKESPAKRLSSHKGDRFNAHYLLYSLVTRLNHAAVFINLYRNKKVESVGMHGLLKIEAHLSLILMGM